MSKVFSQVRDMLQDMGYTCIRDTGHCIWKHPCGATVTTAASPSDRRALQNIRSIARRELRARGVTVD